MTDRNVNTYINVKADEWLEAKAYFEANPKEIKFKGKKNQQVVEVEGVQKKQSTGHDFVKIAGDIFALNNTSHIAHESDAGLGGFGRVKRAININGRPIVIKVEGAETKKSKGVKATDVLMQDMGYLLDRVERKVKKEEGESGLVKAANHYKTKKKVLTAYEDRGDRDLYNELTVQNQGEYSQPPKNLVYGLKAMMGIQELHDLRIIHLDIKPQNFVLNGRGESLTVMPIDFDLSRRLKSDQKYIIKEYKKGVPKVIGTPGYIAQEIKDFGKYSYASDVFAMGMTF